MLLEKLRATEAEKRKADLKAEEEARWQRAKAKLVQLANDRSHLAKEREQEKQQRKRRVLHPWNYDVDCQDHHVRTEMEAELQQRSSASESEPLPDDSSRSPRKQRLCHEGTEWCHALERDYRDLERAHRQTLQMLAGYLKTRRSASCSHPTCPHCATPLSCPQCTAGAALESIAALRADGANGEAVATFEPKMVEAPECGMPRAAGGAGTRTGADAAEAFDEWPQSLSPSRQSMSVAQEEEPAGEPDAGMLCP